MFTNTNRDKEDVPTGHVGMGTGPGIRPQKGQRDDFIRVKRHVYKTAF